jgi:hypothetical protein
MRDAIVEILLNTFTNVRMDDVYRAADAIVRKMNVPRETIEIKKEVERGQRS